MVKTKVVAFYLPQYHEILENNLWWGDKFTEWDNVKSAKSLFKGHYQPKVPYKEVYYDLSDSSVLFGQAELARKYEVDGFCFYHYWFKGKKLLEKPMELLLEHPEINIEYCLSWANETWSRRWTGEEKSILIKQEYGYRDDWEKHIQYLMKFFKDPRYIKIDGKPVVLLYRTFEIEKYDEMIAFWNSRMQKEGMNGIYIIETLNATQREGCASKSSAYVEFEPMYTIYKYSGYFRRLYRYLFSHLNLAQIGFLNIDSYDRVWKSILMRKRNYDKKTFFGAFPDWDNSARKGKSGLILKGSTPAKFRKYFFKQYQKSIEIGNEFIFINAWNEWGEGAYLEPDEYHKFAYLRAIKEVKELFEIN